MTEILNNPLIENKCRFFVINSSYAEYEDTTAEFFVQYFYIHPKTKSCQLQEEFQIKSRNLKIHSALFDFLKQHESIFTIFSELAGMVSVADVKEKYYDDVSVYHVDDYHEKILTISNISLVSPPFNAEN